MGKKKKEKEPEISFDFSKIKNFFSGKNTAAWLILILILIPMFFSAYYRAHPINLPITDDWARSTVYNNIKNNLADEVAKQYPNLPNAQRNSVVNEQFNELLKQNKDDIESQIQATSDYFKTRMKYEDGQTYLLAIDPYQYLRKTQNMIEKGHTWDIEVNGTYYNTYKLAPLGIPTEEKPKFSGMDLHTFMEYNFYKIAHFFNKDTTLPSAVFILPLFISMLATIPAFFIVRKKAGNFGGFISAMLVGIHPVLIGRTAAGFVDTDAYNFFFPLLIAWFFLESFEADTIKKRISYAVLGGISVGLFSWAWSGWWYIFDVVLGTLLIYIVYLLVKLFIENKNNLKKVFTNPKLKNTLLVILVFMVFSALAVSYFGNFEKFYTGPFEALEQAQTIDVAAKSDLWPNVYTTVAELNPSSLKSIVNSLGGKIFFFIALLGTIITLIDKKLEKIEPKEWLFIVISVLLFLFLISPYALGLSTIPYLFIIFIPLLIGLIIILMKNENIDVKYAVFITLWLIGGIYTSRKGVRFILLLVPAFALAFGLFTGILSDMLSRLIRKEFELNKTLSKAIVISVLSLLILIPFMSSAHNTAKGEIPSMNDAWYNALTQIRNESSQDAIINSWWDFGHWFKFVADRRVTLDGGGQNRPQAHWLGKLMLTDSEEQSIAILRMLDCGATNGFDYLNEALNNDSLKTIDVLNEIILMEKDEAEDKLDSLGLTEEQINKVIRNTHCSPPEDYFITSEDMVGKAGVWGHFGGWNFTKSFIYVNTKKKTYEEAVPSLMDKFNWDENEASQYYYDVQSFMGEGEANAWISPWPSYLTSDTVKCTQDDVVVECDYNKLISKDSQQTVVIDSIKVDLNNLNSSSFVINFINTQTGLTAGTKNLKPHAVLFYNNNNIEEYVFDNPELGFDIVIANKNETYMSLVCDPVFSESIFTKLFYLEGMTLDNFEMFYKTNSFTGDKIIVWKVKWPDYE